MHSANQAAAARRHAAYMRGAGRHDAEVQAGRAPTPAPVEEFASLAEAADAAGDLWGSAEPDAPVDGQIAELVAARLAGR